MATSADRDDHDEKDDAEDEEKDEAVAGAKAHADDHASHDHGDHDASDEDDEDDEKPAPAPPPKRAATKRGRGPGAQRALAPSPPARGSLGKSMVLFIVIVGGLGAGFVFLGREQGQEPAKPKWTAGQTADVEITVIADDRKNLACADADEMAGKHCAFEAQNKPWSKGDVTDDKKLLKPYTTTDRIQFVAAGLWSDPALSPDKLPTTRFNVKCKYKVDGILKGVAVRWETGGQWYPNNDWYAGSVFDCKILQ